MKMDAFFLTSYRRIVISKILICWKKWEYWGCRDLQVLHPAGDSININKEIWSMYLEVLLPKLTVPEDDGNYGSASVCDVLCLQVSAKPWNTVLLVEFVGGCPRFNATLMCWDLFRSQLSSSFLLLESDRCGETMFQFLGSFQVSLPSIYPLVRICTGETKFAQTFLHHLSFSRKVVGVVFS